jgi:hypothetical protein
MGTEILAKTNDLEADMLNGSLPVVEKIQASPRATRSGLVAAIMTLAALMDLLDGTVVNVALPTVQRELHADATDVRWIVSSYMLAFAATLITAGRLGDSSAVVDSSRPALPASESRACSRA